MWRGCNCVHRTAVPARLPEGWMQPPFLTGKLLISSEVQSTPDLNHSKRKKKSQNC